MKINLLSHKTDLIISSFSGKITDKGDYLVIKTSSEPDYFWGNYLLFTKEPQEGDYEKWTNIYKYEFGDNPGFMTFTWDSSKEGLTEEFIKNDFKLNKCHVLELQKAIKPLKYNKNVEIRELKLEDDWEQYVEVHINENWGLSNQSQKAFLEGQRESAKKIVESGKGKRFGAFLGKKLVGEAGIYYEGNLGRYNQISTHQNFRRQGICGTLVYNTAKIAFETMGIKTLVIVADEEYHAAKIYMNVGFKVCEKQISLEWFDKNIY
jgi:hypothetical protein